MKVKSYLRKNGKFMIYLNGSNGVSVGLGERVYTSKFTKGEKNTLREFNDIIDTCDPVFVGELDFSKHEEPKTELDLDFVLFITDIAKVCGVSVGSDGAYLYDKETKKLYDIDEI